MEAVRIIGISDPIPNDTMSFGPGFPEDLKAEIFAALVAFSETDAWEQSALGSEEGYSWSTLTIIEDTVFDSVRLQFEVLGLTEEELRTMVADIEAKLENGGTDQ